MVPTKLEVLKLYKELLRYCENIALTDKNYLKKKIQLEFSSNKNNLDKSEFFYKKGKALLEKRRIKGKKLIDKSLIPTIKPNELEEQFIRGSGPGGSRVNKINNCVSLIHKPTGLRVKVHTHREQESNRKLAREKLISMLDNKLNGFNSVENQKKAIDDKKRKNKIYKQKKLLEKKTKWKELINSVNDNNKD